MTYFLRSGSAYTPTPEANLDVHKALPAGNYIIKQTPQGQYYLDGVDSFQNSGKVYGNTLKHCDRILNTFADRENSTGVMLTGEKGSGKTLLARMLSITGAAQSGIPTIIINAPHRGDAFNQLIQSIDQPAIIMFDEFEKVYDSDEQEEILTLLDGVFPSKKLFILTCNNSYRVDSHMRNRPGRIFYMLEFEGLEAEFITEYCNERLDDKSHIPTIVRLASLFHSFNFDILKAVVEEMNRYRETPHQVLKLLNAKPFSDNESRFKIAVNVKGVDLTEDDHHPTEYRSHPVSQQVIEIYDYISKSKDENDESVVYKLRPDDLKNVDAANGIYSYVTKNGDVKVTFTKIKTTPYRWEDAF